MLGSMENSFSDDHAIAFGGYTFIPQRCELLAEDGRCIALGFRATLLLQALIAAGGRILSQQELLAQVWPGQDIHEGNLRVQIAALRKALAGARDMIGTVAGRGYLFSGRVRIKVRQAAAGARRGLPLPVTAMIGREQDVAIVLQRLASGRMLTLAGCAGIGKTLLALSVAHRLPLASGAEARWVDLDAAAPAQGVAGAIAAALALPGATPLPGLLRLIGARQLLLVLDNCEHVADECSRVADALLRHCPGVTLLATSRHPLLADEEAVYRVPPLAVPEEGEQDAALLAACSAVQLFLARARSADSAFAPEARTLAVIGTICRRLEGIPLAIELAAARVSVLGVDQTAAGLGDMLRLLRGGRRTAPARQQTLRAALDWSYVLLPETARAVLCRLAALPACFTLDAAQEALRPHGLDDAQVAGSLASLAAHSLLVPEAGRYRMLATTRAYGMERARHLPSTV